VVVISFSIFLICFVLIGVLSNLRSKKTSEDYLLADHNESPWRIALSTAATNNSGYMFIGMMGYTYLNGLSAIWIMISMILGDFCSSLYIHKRMRIAAEKTDAISFLEVIGNWGHENYARFRSVGSVILVIFLSMYAAAQFKAGGKALYALFGFDYAIGSLIGALVVLCYTVGGGIRASIWTNTVQSLVMLMSMILLSVAAIISLGGFDNYVIQLQEVAPEYVSIFPDGLYSKSLMGLGLFCLGWFFGGFGVIGQPHVMTNFIATARPKDIRKIRHYYYSWYIAFFALVIVTGMAARILIPMNSFFDPELAMPGLAQQILPDILIGFVLAGLFSAIMSTADSQIISCSAAISNDLFSHKHPNYLVVKSTTVVVTIFAALIAIADSQSVFSLAMLSWLALACAFAPIIIVCSCGGKVSENTAIAMMIIGVSVMLLWRFLGLGDGFYEAGPGILSALGYYGLVKLLGGIFKKN
jgi:sodium/proline symporter